MLRDLIYTRVPEQYKREYLADVRIANANRFFLCCLFIACSKSLILGARVIHALFMDGPAILFTSDNMLTVLKILIQLIFAVTFFNNLSLKRPSSRNTGFTNYFYIVSYIFIQFLMVRFSQNHIYEFADGVLVISIVPIFGLLESAIAGTAYLIIMLIQLLSVSFFDASLLSDITFFLMFSLGAFAVSRLTYVSFAKSFVSEKQLLESRNAIQQIVNKLEILSVTDQLTSINNRRGFEKSYHLYWDQCVKESAPITVLIMDLDKFKPYNDNYGHLEGDKALVAVAKALKESFLRKTDLIARYGGEEFITALPYCDTSRAHKQAENFRRKIDDLKIPHDFSPVGKFLTISIGVATKVPSEGDDPNELISRADEVLYKAKSCGGNMVAV